MRKCPHCEVNLDDAKAVEEACDGRCDRAPYDKFAKPRKIAQTMSQETAVKVVERMIWRLAQGTGGDMVHITHEEVAAMMVLEAVLEAEDEAHFAIKH